MDGYPVIIRLIDPPLHEFLPAYEELVQDLADLKVRTQHYHTLSEIDAALAEIRVKQDYLERVEALRELNPMLGTRGVRLGILIPELTQMQVRAIFEAACTVAKEGVDVPQRPGPKSTVHCSSRLLIRRFRRPISRATSCLSESESCE